MKLILSLLFLFFYSSSLYSQLESIKEFPKTYETQEVKELTPVWISENETLAFYTNTTEDTIFSRRTTNRGQTWSAQKVEQIIEDETNFEFAVLKTLTGRLVIVWNSKINQITYGYSDDKGFSWVTGVITPGTFTPHQYSLSEINQGKIVLSFALVTKWRSLISLDNGTSWSNEYYFEYGFFPPIPITSPSIISLNNNGDSLIGIFSSIDVIYAIRSSDGGINWSDTTRIIKTNSLPFSPTKSIHALKNEAGTIFLIYNNRYETSFDDYSQYDVSVLFSNDDGITWQNHERFTTYLGNDFLTAITHYKNEILICYNSEKNKPFNQGFYGILDQSLDLNTPPIVLEYGVKETDRESNTFVYNVLIVDDESVSKVIVGLENGTYADEMFDDGLHCDSLAHDNIWGNTFPILRPTALHSSTSYAIEVNKIKLPLNGKGVLAHINTDGYALLAEVTSSDLQNNSSIRELSASIPYLNPGFGGRFEESMFLFSGGFFLSGYSNGELWSNAVASATLVEDYIEGIVGSERFDPLNQFYIVNKQDIPFGTTWQHWKDAVLLGAEFYDGDKNGIYNPIDKNWNGTWEPDEDMPALIGNETIFCVYNDGISANLRRWGSEPQGIEIRQIVFASDNPELENVIFIRYSILNTGTVTDVMDSVYIGIWLDGDVGDHTDDVVGCDTILNSALYYNEFPDDVYGEDCPSFFTTFLQGPIVKTNNINDTANVNYGSSIGYENLVGAKNLGISSHVAFIGGDPDLNDPSNKIEARNFIEGKTRVGEYPNPCNFPYGQVRGGVDCNEVDHHFWFSGDPVTDTGWMNVMNLDHRNLLSTGPFQLEKDKPQEIIIAYVIGRGTDYLNSITVARENVRRAIEEYESNFASMTYTPPPPTSPVVNFVLYQNYPNPFNPVTTIRYELPQDGIVKIDIYDILGQKVKTILNEYKQADRYEVRFNASGLASGVYIYRIRVNDFVESKKMILLK